MNSDLKLSYDEHADVLYICMGDPVPAETDEDDRGLLLRTALSDGHPCGVTVMDYQRRWHARMDELADAVAAHLQLPVGAVQQALTK